MLDLQTKEISSSERIYSIDLQGILDSKSSHDFFIFLQNQVKNGYTKFIVKCENLQFATSGGIGCILRIGKELSGSGIFTVFVGLNLEIRSVLNLFGIEKHILQGDSVESAIRILKAAPKKKMEPSEKKEHSVSVGAVKEIQFSFDTKTEIEEESEVQIVSGKQPGAIDVSPSDWIKLKNENETDSVASRLTQKIRDVKEERQDVRVIFPRTDPNPALGSENISQPAAEALTENQVVTPVNDDPNKVEMYFEDQMEFSDDFEIVHDDSYLEPGDEYSPSELPDVIENEAEKKLLRNETGISTPDTGVTFTNRIINCESCGARIRIGQPGRHQCPSCNSIFIMRPSGAVSYLEKLI